MIVDQNAKPNVLPEIVDNLPSIIPFTLLILTLPVYCDAAPEIVENTPSIPPFT